LTVRLREDLVGGLGPHEGVCPVVVPAVEKARILALSSLTERHAPVGMCFMPVTDAKIVKNRGHIDLTSGPEDRAAEIERLRPRWRLGGLTTSLAAATAGSGVTVNLLVPGFVDTDRSPGQLSGALLERIQAVVPMRRPAQIAEIVSVGMFLASDEASYMTGQTVVVSGGAYPMIG
jgi:NAD(P)-dependent dehydrogenase (short-subunit alcohol dehydrogenase family)